MSSAGTENRSFEKITAADLRRLSAIAAQDRSDFFRRRPDWAIYASRVLCTALCQGAATHFLHGNVGVNDFDVYTFYADPEGKWSPRVRRSRDFGDPKFGRSADAPFFVGRRVDLMGRGIPARPGDNPVAAVRQYLQTPLTKTAKMLAAKAVVLLDPDELLGTVVWPVKT